MIGVTCGNGSELQTKKDFRTLSLFSEFDGRHLSTCVLHQVFVCFSGEVYESMKFYMTIFILLDFFLPKNSQL